MKWVNTWKVLRPRTWYNMRVAYILAIITNSLGVPQLDLESEHPTGKACLGVSCECDLHNGWGPADVKGSLQLQVRSSPGSSSCHRTVPQQPHLPCFLPNSRSTRKWNKAAEPRASSSPLSLSSQPPRVYFLFPLLPFISYPLGLPEWGHIWEEDRRY